MEDNSISKSIYLDHVLLGARDLPTATARLHDEHGLVALSGGLLAGGLRNAIVPLRDGQYLELIAVDEPRPAEPSSTEQWIIDATEGGDRPVWFAIRSDDLDAVAKRTGRPVIHNVAREAGGPMRGGWRSIWPAGGAHSGLPFFIDYDTPWDRQLAIRDADYARAASPAHPGSIISVDVVGVESGMLWSWLGASEGSLPLRPAASGAQTGIAAVRIASADGEITIC